MKQRTWKSTYRGHEIIVTEHTPNGADRGTGNGSFYTATHDVQAEANGPDSLKVHESGDEARQAAEADIEATLDAASTEEIQEKMSDYASEAFDHVNARTAKALADAIQSARKRGTTTDTTILNFIEAVLHENTSETERQFRAEEAAREDDDLDQHIAAGRSRASATKVLGMTDHELAEAKASDATAETANRRGAKRNPNVATLRHCDNARNFLQAIAAKIEIDEADARAARTNWGHAGTAAHRVELLERAANET